MSADTLPTLLTGGVGAIAVMGIVLGLILSGKLHTHAEMERADNTIKELTLANDKKEEALTETRRALAEASARADQANRNMEVIAGAFRSASGRRSSGHVP